MAGGQWRQRVRPRAQITGRPAFSRSSKTDFFEQGLETADYDAIGCATRLGPAEGLLPDGRRDGVRGEDSDFPAVEQCAVSGVIVIKNTLNRERSKGTVYGSLFPYIYDNILWWSECMRLDNDLQILPFLIPVILGNFA